MAILTLSQAKSQPTKRRRKQSQSPKQQSPWDQIKSLLTCKHIQASTVHDPSSSSYSKLGSSCNSICSFRDVVHGNTRVVHRADHSPDSSTILVKPNRGNILTNRRNSTVAAHAPPASRGMPLRKLSGCYECRMIVDPSRYPYTPRATTTICACSECGEVFTKMESLELHRAVRHAVSELGPEDSGRNIVEIIFKSSWQKKDSSICKIERILKVCNAPRTIRRFEDCRDAVKARATTATKKNPRCAADGNELLRFHCATLSCALGARGATGLCGASSSGPHGEGCAVCAIIRHGFQGKGVRTTASSGRAHDSLSLGRPRDGRRAMLVCRVIAGRVRRVGDDAPPVGEEDESLAGSFDSVAGWAHTNLEDLLVFNPRAILPCFVVIYTALEI